MLTKQFLLWKKTGFTAYDSDSRVIFIYFNSFSFVGKGGDESNVISPPFSYEIRPSSAYWEQNHWNCKGAYLHTTYPHFLVFHVYHFTFLGDCSDSLQTCHLSFAKEDWNCSSVDCDENRRSMPGNCFCFCVEAIFNLIFWISFSSCYVEIHGVLEACAAYEEARKNIGTRHWIISFSRQRCDLENISWKLFSLQKLDRFLP